MGAKIKKCAKAKGLLVTSTSTYDWFEQIPKANRHSVFDSLVAKAKEQDAESEKNAKKGRKNFVELLQKTREISAKTTYDEAKKLLKGSSAWDAVDDQTRKQCFKIFVDQLKLQNDNDDDDDDDDDRRRKEKNSGKDK